MKSLIALPKGMKYDTQFFCQQLGADFKSNICSEARRRTLKGHLIHPDKACSESPRSSNQYPEATNARRVLHPECSPNLSPDDFFLSRFQNEKLRGISLTDEEGLISRGQAIFDEIPESILISVDMT
jgi:hypothetical protein